MSNIPFAVTTPVSVSRVGLRARDAEKLAAYYRAVVGLQELSRADGAITLGAAGRPLLVIEADPAARPDDPRSAGLFHTAFLLPSRADLGRWVRHAIDRKIAIDGASDHLVSEALYLTDPEGNGIEIYADRPHESWKWNGPSVEMATLRLDIPNLVAAVPEGDAGWKGAPENSVIGHVHLQGRRSRPGRDMVARAVRLRHGLQDQRQRRVPVVRRLPPPYRRQFLAERRRRAPRSVAGGAELGRDAVEERRSAETASRTLGEL